MSAFVKEVTMICKENNLLHNNLGIKENNLTFAGYDTVALAKKYGTPLMLLDENKIRHPKCSFL